MTRGGADLWPENTLPAFEGAIACGADGAELDVHLASDGELVVFHDETLKPEIVRRDGVWITERTPIKNLTVADLAKKQGATLVLDKSGPTLFGIPAIIFADPAYDITQQVIDEVNKDRPPAPATTPAAAIAS